MLGHVYSCTPRNNPSRGENDPVLPCQDLSLSATWRTAGFFAASSKPVLHYATRKNQQMPGVIEFEVGSLSITSNFHARTRLFHISDLFESWNLCVCGEGWHQHKCWMLNHQDSSRSSNQPKQKLGCGGVWNAPLPEPDNMPRLATGEVMEANLWSARTARRWEVGGRCENGRWSNTFTMGLTFPLSYARSKWSLVAVVAFTRNARSHTVR